MKVSKLRQWLRQFGPDEEVEFGDYNPILKVRRRDLNPIEHHELCFTSEKSSKHILVNGNWIPAQRSKEIQ